MRAGRDSFQRDGAAPTGPEVVLPREVGHHVGPQSAQARLAGGRAVEPHLDLLDRGAVREVHREARRGGIAARSDRPVHAVDRAVSPGRLVGLCAPPREAGMRTNRSASRMEARAARRRRGVIGRRHGTAPGERLRRSIAVRLNRDGIGTADGPRARRGALGQDGERPDGQSRAGVAGFATRARELRSAQDHRLAVAELAGRRGPAPGDSENEPLAEPGLRRRRAGESRLQGRPVRVDVRARRLGRLAGGRPAERCEGRGHEHRVRNGRHERRAPGKRTLGRHPHGDVAPSRPGARRGPRGDRRRPCAGRALHHQRVHRPAAVPVHGPPARARQGASFELLPEFWRRDSATGGLKDEYIRMSVEHWNVADASEGHPVGPHRGRDRAPVRDRGPGELRRDDHESAGRDTSCTTSTPPIRRTSR